MRCRNTLRAPWTFGVAVVRHKGQGQAWEPGGGEGGPQGQQAEQGAAEATGAAGMGAAILKAAAGRGDQGQLGRPVEVRRSSNDMRCLSRRRVAALLCDTLLRGIGAY